MVCSRIREFEHKELLSAGVIAPAPLHLLFIRWCGNPRFIAIFYSHISHNLLLGTTNEAPHAMVSRSEYRLQIRSNAELDWSTNDALLFSKLAKQVPSPHTCIASLAAYGLQFGIQ